MYKVKEFEVDEANLKVLLAAIREKNERYFVENKNTRIPQDLLSAEERKARVWFFATEMKDVLDEPVIRENIRLMKEMEASQFVPERKPEIKEKTEKEKHQEFVDEVLNAIKRLGRKSVSSLLNGERKLEKTPEDAVCLVAAAKKKNAGMVKILLPYSEPEFAFDILERRGDDDAISFLDEILLKQFVSDRTKKTPFKKMW